jgi:septum formation protein
MPPVDLVLGSASPARLALLRAAGIDPHVVVSDVDEDAVAAAIGTDDPEALVLALARAKAEAVAARVGAPAATTLVLGCDSLFTIDGVTWGKPADAAEAVARIRSMRGRSGVLRTGHHLVDPAGRRSASGVEATTVRFGPMSDAEVDAYVASGEPLRVAGSFTLDGRSAPFVDGIDGDHTNVVGLSLPLLRRLLGELRLSVTDLWADAGGPA